MKPHSGLPWCIIINGGWQTKDTFITGQKMDLKIHSTAKRVGPYAWDHGHIYSSLYSTGL